MLDLFKVVTHPHNLRNGLTCGSYKIKTAHYGTETITYLGSKIWSIIPDEISESASLETFIVPRVAFAKNILQMLASLIFHEFQ